MWAQTSKSLNLLSFTSKQCSHMPTNQLSHLGTTDSYSYRKKYWEVGIEPQRLPSQAHEKIWECSKIQTDYLTTLEQLKFTVLTVSTNHSCIVAQNKKGQSKYKHIKARDINHLRS